MAENDNPNSKGKKVFFLHPSAVIQNQVITELAQEEYEVYVIKDEEKLRLALRNYPDSILFASINEVLKESDWEELIRGILGNPETSEVMIGIIASSKDENLIRKYIGQYRVPCGYTIIKSDSAATLKQISGILDAVYAKGRRKYIRMMMEKETNVTVNIPINGTYINGVIKDISVVGFSCTFANDPGLTKNGLFEDIQLRLQAQLLNVEGIVFGSYVEGEEKNYVVLFTQRVDSNSKSKIRKYINSNLQNRMDQKLK